MAPLELLLKDPPFWLFFALFLGSLSIFVWSLGALRALSPYRDPHAAYPELMAPVTKSKSPWRFPPPVPPPSLPPSGAESGGPKTAPAPSFASPAASHAGSGKADSSVVLSMVEEKFAELAKRIVAVESGKKDQPPSYLGPLLKRVSDMEGEIKSLKSAFSQLAAAQNAVNMTELTSKIASMQKLLENLTGGTDVSKPS